LRRADHSSKESYQPSVSVRLPNLIRGGQGPIWAVSAIEEEEELSTGTTLTFTYLRRRNSRGVKAENLESRNPTIQNISNKVAKRGQYTLLLGNFNILLVWVYFMTLCM
jgi:hypothetical protein